MKLAPDTTQDPVDSQIDTLVPGITKWPQTLKCLSNSFTDSFEIDLREFKAFTSTTVEAGEGERDTNKGRQ